MEVEFFIDKLVYELDYKSGEHQYVEIKTYLEKIADAPPIFRLRIFAEPKGFLRMILGRWALLDARVERLGDGKYSIKLKDLNELFDRGIRDIKELNKRCERLIMKLADLAREKEDKR